MIGIRGGLQNKIGQLAVLVILVAFPAAGMFVLPAMLLWASGAFRKLDRLTRGVYCLFFGLACWTSLPWLTRYLPLSLSSLIRIVVILLGVAVAMLKTRGRHGSELPEQRMQPVKLLLMAALLGLVVSLRLLPTLIPNVPPGPDMTMHAYNARLMIDSDSIPTTHRPLLPIDSFGEYPIGFALLSATTTLVTGMEVQQSALLWVGITHILLTLGLFLLLRVWFSPGIALLTAALASLLSAEPQRFVLGGTCATVLSLAFLTAALSLFLSLDRRHSFLEKLIQASLWAAAFLSHSVLSLAAGYCLAALALAYTVIALIRRQFADLKRRAAQSALIIVFALLLTVPFWLGFSANVSDNEVEWNKMWQREDLFGFHGSIRDFYWTIPVYVALASGYHFFFVAAAALFISTLDRRFRLWIVLLSFVLCAMILNSAYWVLPFSNALYPERVQLLLFVPMSILLAGLVNRIHSFIAAAGPTLKQILWTGTPNGQSNKMLGWFGASLALIMPLSLIPVLLDQESDESWISLVSIASAFLLLQLLFLWLCRQDRKQTPVVFALAVTIAAAGIAAGYSCASYAEYYLRPYALNAVLTEDDLQVFELIRENTSESDVFLNLSYEDESSLWIPAMCGRGILQPHWCPLYLDELVEGNRDVTPDYLFIGSHASSSRGGDLHWLKKARSLPCWEELVCVGSTAVFKLVPSEDENDWREIIEGTDHPLLPE